LQALWRHFGTLAQAVVTYPRPMRPVAGWSNGPVTVVLTQEDLRLLVAALETATEVEAQELRDGLARFIGEDAPDR
jgi:hypothetical protein